MRIISWGQQNIHVAKGILHINIKKILFCIGKYYEEYLLWAYEVDKKVSNN
jgi:hypothetical protein